MSTAFFETVACYSCGSSRYSNFVSAQDDLTGKPGTFTFVSCEDCGLTYQNPRITLEGIKPYYDSEYIAHRKKTDWGALTWFYNRAMDRHDVQKAQIASRYVRLGPGSEVLDVGCAVGTFLQKMRRLHGVRATGIDFKDLKENPSLRDVDFRCGLFYEQDLGDDRFDLITMWHFLEHDYDPVRTLAAARKAVKPDGRLIIEVPRLDSLTFWLYHERWPGLQAPQHTVLYEKKTLLRVLQQSGFEVVDYLALRGIPRILLPVRGRRVQDSQGTRPQLVQSDRALLSRAMPDVSGATRRTSSQPGHADRDLQKVVR